MKRQWLVLVSILAMLGGSVAESYDPALDRRFNR
jgi:hypothetical protein